ncbi:MAG: response regulator, partial [Desulfarculus sp.]|nr:response regulator [Desulfarculus sp.]
YRVLTAQSGEEALELYRDQGGGLDLVLMDLGMPGMGGHKALKEILAHNPRAKVIIASGYSAGGQVKDSLESGAAGYVAKPFRRAELLGTVRKVLDQG